MTFENKWNAASNWSQQHWKLISSAKGYQRQRLQKVTMNSGGGALRSRTWTNAYELSQDLHAKQVEILEKKYGGSWRSRHAATIIQRAYRHYCLNRNFAKLRWEADEKRLSRRFAEFSHSRTVWCDLAATIEQEQNRNEVEHSGVDEVTYSEYDSILSHSYSSDNMLHHFISQKSSRAYRHVTKTVVVGTEDSSTADKCLEALRNNLVLACESLELDLRQKKVGKKSDGRLSDEPHAENSYISGHGHLELSDSSESMQPSPLEPAVDLPSACFESLLEKQEAGIFDDSFSSDSCEDNDDTTSVNESSKSGQFHDCMHAKTFKDCEAKSSCALPVKGSTDVTSDHDNFKSASTQDSPVRYRQKSSVKKVTAKNGDDLVSSKPDKLSPDGSPVWKRKSRNIGELNISISEVCSLPLDSPCSLSSNSRKTRSSTTEGVGERGLGMMEPVSQTINQSGSQSVDENHVQPNIIDRSSRKRAYRIGLNLFNKKPENGVKYLITKQFLDQRPIALAKFLIARKGLSKQMIGEYLGNLQKPFNMEVLRCFANEIDLTGLEIDVALRKFQSYFRMPGEAQKIERLMEAFAAHYCQSNPEHLEQFHSSETVFLLAFAIIMLNTDLHNSNIKSERKMKVTDFIRNLRGIDGGQDIDADLLSGMYERIRGCELKPGADHVSHVFKLEQMIFGNKPQLSLPHRRLVCYCRMFEVHDPLKRDKTGQHQRELFLFNDVLMVTKIFNKKKRTSLYSFRQMFSLFGMVVHVFESQYYKFGLRLSADSGKKSLITLNARNEHDRRKFVEDLKESILEVTEMEGLRIEEELKKQKLCPGAANLNRYSKDSGVVDIEMLKLVDSSVNRLSAPECERLKKSTLSNSLIDITDHNRRGSGVSLDSGVASAESESVGSCQEANRISRIVGLSPTPNADHIVITDTKMSALQEPLNREQRSTPKR